MKNLTNENIQYIFPGLDEEARKPQKRRKHTVDRPIDLGIGLCQNNDTVGDEDKDRAIEEETTYTNCIPSPKKSMIY